MSNTVREPAISVQGLTKTYGRGEHAVEAVKGIDLRVEPGQTYGFLGPNGAGKSTTIEMLCTHPQPDRRQSARVAGYDVVRERDEVRRRIGLVFQQQTLDQQLTAQQNLRFHADLYGLSRADADRRIDEVLEMVALADRRNDEVQKFSGGMKRRLEIARGLVHAPQVLFLDEPTIGLDPADPQRDLGLPARSARPHRDHRVRDHALHGRGRALRPDRDHGQRRDRGRGHARRRSSPASAPTGSRCAPTTTSSRSAGCGSGSASRPRCTRDR